MKYLIFFYKNYFFQANPVEKFTVQWNTDLNLGAKYLFINNFTDIQSLKSISSTSYTGYVVSLPSSKLIEGRQNVNLPNQLNKV